MARRDLSKDITTHASDELGVMLRRESKASTPGVPTVSVDDALHGPRVVEHETTRDVVRVLFISTDDELLTPTKQSLDGYLNISEVFAEVHILVLRQGIAPKQPVLRPEANVFLYTVATNHWWQLPLAGLRMIESQLVFANGFRPDLVVARDPFASALTALLVQRKFPRAQQLHVLEDIFAETANLPWWHRQLCRFVLSRFTSIRTRTHHVLQQVSAQVSDEVDVAKLPQLNPYETTAVEEGALDLKHKYPQYVFFLLYAGSMQDGTAALEALNSAEHMLRNARIALIMIGDGPAVAECQARARALGIHEQVIFERRPVSVTQYLKAAQLLLVTETTESSEELVVQAAVAGIPMVMARTERRLDVFIHRESAYMADAGDTVAFGIGVTELMEQFELRSLISEQAAAAIHAQFHDNTTQYRDDYRRSIESALFVGEDPTENT